MGTTVAAMKAKLGTTEYFIIAMKAKELIEKTIIPAEMDGWEEFTMQEREQRDINYARVKNQIAPYLANDKDRFFGAIILTAKNFDASNFEPIADIATKGLPNLYKTQAKVMGFLTFTGGEELIPLDGQHRLKAIEFAIKGEDEKSRKIEGLKPCSDLSNEEVTVIIVPYDKRKSRLIFTKVNRYAKPTTTGQNLVTDDEDFIAISSRMVADDIIGSDLVKYTSNSLRDREGYFTTLATVASCNESILAEHYPSDAIDRTRAIEDTQKKALYEDKIRETWEHLIENIELFSDMLSDKTEAGNEKRSEVRRDYLLGKPIPQVCLFKAFVRLEASNDFTLKEASDILNKFNWQKNAEIWDRLLISGNKILTKNAKLADSIIYYMAGGKYKEGFREKDKYRDKEKLLEDYRNIFPPEKKDTIKLPELVR